MTTATDVDVWVRLWQEAEDFLHRAKQKRMLTKVDVTDAMNVLAEEEDEDKALKKLVERNRIWAEYGPR